MVYKIFKNDKLINTIVADEAFVKQYCKDNNYTYEAEERETPSQPETPIIQPKPTIEELMQQLTQTQIALTELYEMMITNG